MNVESLTKPTRLPPNQNDLLPPTNQHAQKKPEHPPPIPTVSPDPPSEATTVSPADIEEFIFDPPESSSQQLHLNSKVPTTQLQL